MLSRRRLLSRSVGTLTGALLLSRGLAGIGSARAATPTRDKLTVAVLGATGRTGSKVVDALLAQGYAVKGISRRASQQMPRPGIDWINADVREPMSLQATLQGAQAVVYSVGVDFTKSSPKDLEDAYHTGVEAAAGASFRAGIRRFVLQSSAGRVRSRDLPPEYRASMDAKAGGEAALRAIGLGYSIVRTPGVWDRPGGELGILLLQGELPVGGPFMINRTDIAAVLVECAITTKAVNKTFTILNAATFERDSWRDALAGLSVD